MAIHALALLELDPRTTVIRGDVSVAWRAEEIGPSRVFTCRRKKGRSEEVAVGVVIESPPCQLQQLVRGNKMRPRVGYSVDDASGLVVIDAIDLLHLGSSDTADAWPAERGAGGLSPLALEWRAAFLVGSMGSPSAIVPAPERPAPAGTEPLLVEIVGDIGELGRRAVDLVPQIEAADAAIVVEIDSAGGNVDDAMAIYNALARHPFAVFANIENARSAAAIVALAADVRLIDPAGEVLLHPMTSSLENANVRDLLDHSKRMLDLTLDCAKIVAARTGVPIHAAQTWLSRETRFGAGDAITSGLAHGLNEYRAPSTPRARKARFAPLNGPYRSSKTSSPEAEISRFEIGRHYSRGARVGFDNRVFVARRDCLAVPGREPGASSDWRVA